MNKLSELLSKPYKNLEQKDAIKLLEDIEKVVEGQDNQLEIVCEELKKVNAENRDLKHIGALFQGEKLQRDENKALTNFDRIKNMTIEELAEFIEICNASFPPCYNCPSERNCGTDNCNKHVCSWLNQPVESEDNQDAK